MGVGLERHARDAGVRVRGAPGVEGLRQKWRRSKARRKRRRTGPRTCARRCCLEGVCAPGFRSKWGEKGGSRKGGQAGRCWSDISQERERVKERSSPYFYRKALLQGPRYWGYHMEPFRVRGRLRTLHFCGLASRPTRENGTSTCGVSPERYTH